MKDRFETSCHRQKQIRNQPKPAVCVKNRFEDFQIQRICNPANLQSGESAIRRVCNLASLPSGESAIQRIQLNCNLANLQFGEAEAAVQRIQLNCNLANLQLGEAAIQRICKSAIQHRFKIKIQNQTQNQIQNQKTKVETN